MKILFLTSEGFDTPNSINHLCSTLLEDILNSGIEVYSISSHRSGIYSDIPDKLKTHKRFSYDIIPRKNIDKNNFLFRYIDEIKYAFQAMQKWRIHSDIDAVLLQSNPNSVYNALLLKLRLKKPIILNLYDIFPGHAMSIGVIKNKFIYEILRSLQKILYRKCKYIVAMSADMNEQLLTENVPESNIKVINNWFDNTAFDSLKRENNRFFQKYSLDRRKFYIQFAGLLGYVFDFQMYLDVAEKFKTNNEITFLLIGDGNQKELILNEIHKRKLDNILYFPWQPLEIISDVYNACDIGFIPLKQGVIGNGIPSKACQLMAASRVILNSVEESNYTALFDKYHIGINVKDHDPNKVFEAINYLYHHREEMMIIGKNARDYAYLHFSRETNTKKFVELIKSLMN